MAKPIIIYDDACPMCKLYTAGFERAGWVERTGFSKASKALKTKLDLDRARHEIPLYDPEKKQVEYGMNALFKVLGNHFPLLRPLFAFLPFRWLIYGLYQLITYNRRVIAGSAPPKEGFDCAPDRHVGMRLLYIGLASVAIGLILGKMVGLYGTAILLAFPMLVLNWGFLKKEDALSFLGHWITVLLAAVLSLKLLIGLPIWIALCLSAIVYSVLWWKRRWVLLPR